MLKMCKGLGSANHDSVNILGNGGKQKTNLQIKTCVADIISHTSSKNIGMSSIGHVKQSSCKYITVKPSEAYPSRLH